jgi:hypothetical protein
MVLSTLHNPDVSRKDMGTDKDALTAGIRKNSSLTNEGCAY